jgi:large subunit ribosomal protein L28
MLRNCIFCGKGKISGNTIVRRGMAKKKGGAGRRITGISKRKFLPNLQRIKVIIDKQTKRVYVCTKCIKAGKIQKA